MDRSWILSRNRASPEYFKGTEEFLKIAFEGLQPDARVKCPCKKCYFRKKLTSNDMFQHIIGNGFLESYMVWTYHGEKSRTLQQSQDAGMESNSLERHDMVGMVNELMGVQHSDVGLGDEHPEGGDEEGDPSNANQGMDDETRAFFDMLEAATRPLFKGCQKFTSLSFIIRLLHIKVLGGMTNKCCTLILELLHEALEELGDLHLPKSYYEANKMTEKLGFDYETIDACPRSCMLFRNEDKDLDRCRYCQESRYKEPKVNLNGEGRPRGKRLPRKQMRYFPLKPRLKRLFRSSHTASLMTWHADERVNDGVLRHPADSPAWKALDERFPSFACEARNVRFGLAADGFNPYRTMSIAHSTWPVLLIPYNLPSWECMKQTNFILSVLIDGPKGPGQKIDVFLQPLIDELKELWLHGINAYDVSRNQKFTLRAALLWTINDFPALGDLMGYGVRGELACPCCLYETKSLRLKHGGKFCYWGHRRWLDKSHKFRREKASFDGKQEWGSKPKALSGTEILELLKAVETVYKKDDILGKRKREEIEKEKEKERKARARKEKQAQKVVERAKGRRNGKGKLKTKQNVDRSISEKSGGFKKKSIFFELPYWEHNLVRHNLDVMHIEKNVCDNILYTLLGIKGKSKDSWKSRLDLKELNIREPLHLQQTSIHGKKVMPPASFTMSKKEKEIFLTVLKNVRVPDGYASNISRCVNMDTLSISGLKSHDSHILMQQLLPIALRKAISNVDVVETIIELSNFFRIICSKMNKLSDLEYIQDRIAVTLCRLEKIFPPSFFDIMEHLPIHLAEQALATGAVAYTWMYPIERYLSTLKGYVRNQARPEGSIAKGYQMEECMTFCGRYLEDVETKLNRLSRNDISGDNSGRHFGQAVSFNLDLHTRDQIHRYVLANTESIQPYFNVHLAFLKDTRRIVTDRELYRIHNEEFPRWFKQYVVNKTIEGVVVEEDIKQLALGPCVGAQRFKGYLINGYRFRIVDVDNNKVAQNSGVALDATTRSYSSCNDANPVSGDVTFFGRLKDIIEVSYTGERKYVMFRCDWVDGRKGQRVDHYKFTSVNFGHLLYKDNKLTDEPFIFASQAEQVMYIQDPRQLDWHVAIRMTSRDTFDMGVDDCSTSTTQILQSQPYAPQIHEVEGQQEDEFTWVRHDIEGVPITTHGNSKRKRDARIELGGEALHADIEEDGHNFVDEPEIDEDDFEEGLSGDSDDDDIEELESDNYSDDASNDDMELDD